MVGTIVAYLCWFTGLRHLPAGTVAIVGLLNPVMGTALGVALAAEAFGPVQALGMALVIGGVLAGQLRRRPRSTAPAPEPALSRS